MKYAQSANLTLIQSRCVTNHSIFSFWHHTSHLKAHSKSLLRRSRMIRISDMYKECEKQSSWARSAKLPWSQLCVNTGWCGATLTLNITTLHCTGDASVSWEIFQSAGHEPGNATILRAECLMFYLFFGILTTKMHSLHFILVYWVRRAKREAGRNNENSFDLCILRYMDRWRCSSGPTTQCLILGFHISN